MPLVPENAPESQRVHDFDDLLERLEGLVAEFEAHEDERTRKLAQSLLAGLDTLHREALSRLVALLREEGGEALLERLREDPVVEWLLEAYELIPVRGAEDLVEQALEEVRPYIHSHGGEMEFVAVENGVVRLRLHGACSGCPSSTVTLTQAVEKALRESLPGFERIEVEDEALVHDHQPDGRRPVIPVESLLKKPK